jgi:hypothetical protein
MLAYYVTTLIKNHLFGRAIVNIFFGGYFQVFGGIALPSPPGVAPAGAMASAEARAYKEVCGRSPQWGRGAKPLVRGSGERSPPEADSFFYITVHNFRAQNTDFDLMYYIDQ